ncbi:hypothetical protein NLJ89_g6001 [Agrocybe chaxingu]|uniref:Uncharacterized protein n=1 Tax=Agrocybe chaxingu TaxID=84603 RepID=A0A9W8K1H9_9AGAR|nr:hypothetical protein NLJ89_g6001 [Agrocybe chaxingu]
MAPTQRAAFAAIHYTRVQKYKLCSETGEKNGQKDPPYSHLRALLPVPPPDLPPGRWHRRHGHSSEHIPGLDGRGAADVEPIPYLDGPSSKNRKKASKHNRTDKLDAAIQAGTLLLALVKEAAEFAPIPYLKIAAGTTLKIVNTVQAVRDNKADFERLSQDCVEIIAVAWKSYQRAGDPDKWPKDTADMVETLVTTLSSILDFVEGQIERKRTIRVFYSIADVGKIKEYRERLQSAISKFQVSSHLSIQDALYSLLKGQSDIHARLTGTGPSDPLVQRRLEEEKAQARAREEAEEAAAKKRIEEMEELKAQRDEALKEMIQLQEAREDVDKARIEQEKMIAELKRWKEREEEEAELTRLKEEQRLREEKRLKEENEKRARLAKALVEEEEESDEEAVPPEVDRLRQEEEEKKRRREEKAAALRRKIEKQRTQQRVTISAKVTKIKPPVVEVSSEDEEESEESEDEAAKLARLEAEKKARKAARKKATRGQTTAEDTMRAAFEQMGINAGRTASPSPSNTPPLHGYASPQYPGPYPPYGGHSSYYGTPMYGSPVSPPSPPHMMYPGMFSPPFMSTNNSGNVTNMSMSNMNNDNSIRYGSRRPKKAATTK